MRKVVIVVMVIFMVLISCVSAMGEEFEGNEAYYDELCTNNNGLTPEEKQTCDAYRAYLASKSQQMQEELANIEAKREEIAANVEEYAAKIRTYDAQIATLNQEIAGLNNDILVKEKQISEKQAEIDAKQAEIDSLKKRIEDRMVATQSGMRLNKYIDVLMGAKNLTDFLRRANGIKTISEYDQKTMDEINELIAQLNVIKQELETQKVQLDEAKAVVVEKQQAIVLMRQEAKVVQEEYQKQSADLEAMGNRIATDIAQISETMKNITTELNSVATSPGWTRPVGVATGEGTWHYSSGGVHLGADYPASIGTPVVAVGNGVVLKSSDGCDAGWLGNTCGGSGSYKGGNQVYLLTSINGSTYAVKYLHLLKGTPVASGTIVSAGQQIGQVGTSGNSSGPHCHVEVFYLGTMSISSYATSWNGDLAFGAGWGSPALGRLCENGVGAPCRVKPESVFG